MHDDIMSRIPNKDFRDLCEGAHQILPHQILAPRPPMASSNMEEDQPGTITPVSSSGSTAVEPQFGFLRRSLLPSPQKSPALHPNHRGPPPPPPQSKNLSVPRPGGPRAPRNIMSFSTAQKFPDLEPSQSRLRKQLDLLLLWILQFLAGIYITLIASKNRLLYLLYWLWYDWHVWPRYAKTMVAWDVSKLHKLPRHVAVILDQRREKREYDADEMVRRSTEVAVWCACAGIPSVTFYESNGTLQEESD